MLLKNDIKIPLQIISYPFRWLGKLSPV